MDFCTFANKEILQETLTEKKSSPDIILTEVGQKVDIAEIKCDALKARLNYMKVLYNAHKETQKNKKNIEDIPSNQELLNISNDSISKLYINSRETHKSLTTIVSDQIPQGTKENTESDHCDFFNDIPMSVMVKNLPQQSNESLLESLNTRDFVNQNKSELAFGKMTNSQSVVELSTLNASNMLEKSDIEKELTNGDMDNIIHKNLTKSDKKQKSIYSTLTNAKLPPYSLNEVVGPKYKKRKGRIRCSQSRSTVATRDTSIAGRKDSKRRKHKSHGTTPIIQLPQPNLSSSTRQKKWSDVIDIYHNAAVKSGSISAVSSKHSKFDAQFKNISTESMPPNNLSKNEANKNKNSAYNHSQQPICNTSTFTENNIEKLQESVNKEETKSEEVKMTDGAIELCKAHETLAGSRFDPMIVHNYQMPTVASRLKAAKRSYYHQFHYRNIPFVVGTSVTPSHNLGLNIQQVLNVMKTKQPSVSGVAPVLIRKISKGIKPVTALLEINEQHLTINGNYPTTNIHQQQINVHGAGPTGEYHQNIYSHFVKLPMNPPLNRNSMISEEATTVLDMNNKIENSEDECGKNLQKCSKIQNDRVAITDNTKLNKINKTSAKVSTTTVDQGVLPCVNDTMSASSLSPSSNLKGIKSVFVKLHDDFKEMNTKYEKLQAEAKKNNNKLINKQLADLEAELSVKEEEINAFINLYQEVMILKKEMKSLQEKNNYFYVAATNYPNAKNVFHMPYCSRGCYFENTMEMFHQRKRNPVSTIREPPTSFRLVGLLRQIQSFQKQLDDI